MTREEERKAARTNSGGAGNARDDWVGVWGRQRLPRLEEGAACCTDDCFKGQLAVPSYSSRRSAGVLLSDGAA